MDKAEGSKPRRKRGRYTNEFKANAVALVLDGGRTIESVVEDLGLTRSLFCEWLRQARIDRGVGKGGALTSSGREYLKQLEKENRQLKEDKAILKKWVAFSAKERA